MFHRLCFLIGQILCIAYFLYTGLSWLVARYHPLAIVGHLIYDLVHLALIYQFIKYPTFGSEQSDWDE